MELTIHYDRESGENGHEGKLTGVQPILKSINDGNDIVPSNKSCEIVRSDILIPTDIVNKEYFKENSDTPKLDKDRMRIQLYELNDEQQEEVINSIEYVE